MRKKLFGFLAVLIGVVFFSSCSSSNKSDAATLLTGQWNIVEVNGEKVTAERVPFMEFDPEERRLFGNAGCNNFNASYELDATKPSAVTVMLGMATMMACPDMEAEDKILKTFDRIASVRNGKSASQLQLLDKDGEVLLLLEKAL